MASPLGLFLQKHLDANCQQAVRKVCRFCNPLTFQNTAFAVFTFPLGCVGMEISMPPPNGLAVAAKLRQSFSEIKILFVTMHDSEEMLHTAAAVGASGYLLKTEAEELLIEALQRLEEGHCFVSPSFEPGLAKQLFK